jgi:hypothetical protein
VPVALRFAAAGVAAWRSGGSGVADGATPDMARRSDGTPAVSYDPSAGSIGSRDGGNRQEGVHMATQRSSFEKRERDRNKKAKAAAKREQRLSKTPTTDEEPASAVSDAESAAILQAVAILHQRFEDNEIEFEEFEESKAELMSRLTVE